MAGSEARARFEGAHVARLATVTPQGSPHVVPIVFAVRDDVIYTAVDGKPKSTRQLRRLANIAAQPAVSILVDVYDDDWSLLWWVRADGSAVVHHTGPQLMSGLDALRAKYPQYQRIALPGPVIAVTISKWTAWQV